MADTVKPGSETFASGEPKIRYATVRGPTAELIGQKLAKMRDLPRVIKKGELGKYAGDRFVNQVITAPENCTLTTLGAFIEYIPPGARSNKHAHQNEAMFYILEGEGYDIHDAVKRFDWQAGDVVIVPPGAVHRHYNKSDTKPIVALVINPKPLYLHMNLVYQGLIEPPFNPAHPEGDGAHSSRGG